MDADRGDDNARRAHRRPPGSTPRAGPAVPLHWTAGGRWTGDHGTAELSRLLGLEPDRPGCPCRWPWALAAPCATCRRQGPVHCAPAAADMTCERATASLAGLASTSGRLQVAQPQQHQPRRLVATPRRARTARRQLGATVRAAAGSAAPGRCAAAATAAARAPGTCLRCCCLPGHYAAVQTRCWPPRQTPAGHGSASPGSTLGGRHLKSCRWRQVCLSVCVCLWNCCCVNCWCSGGLVSVCLLAPQLLRCCWQRCTDACGARLSACLSSQAGPVTVGACSHHLPSMHMGFCSIRQRHSPEVAGM